MGNNVSISGSTIGAMAVGPGATAQGQVGAPPAPTSNLLRGQVSVRRATSKQLADVFRQAAAACDAGQLPNIASNLGGAAIAFAFSHEGSAPNSRPPAPGAKQ